MRRRIIIVTLAILLMAAISCVILLSLRDSGPPTRIVGNFSARDISQIQSAVHRQIWRETFPDFSVQTLKSFPTALRTVFKTRVSSIQPISNNIAFAGLHWGTNLTAPYAFYGYVLTNGPAGWRYAGVYWQNPND